MTTDALRGLSVLALDCQAGGATPAYGDLLEVGWAVCAGAGAGGPPARVESRFIVPRTERKVPRAIRELTGWSEACIADAVPEREAWDALREDVMLVANGRPGAPTVIHFARFELTFLRDLHERLGAGDDPFPFDAICVHAIAARLFPDLPRRNIRALAGFLGHSPELMRRSTGHVEATAFIWNALVPLLEERGVSTWTELKAWLEEPAPKTERGRRSFPMPVAERRALPDRAGVYRFVRKNGDILYVGKATSLKKRIAGHFKSKGPATERGLELLTQVHHIDHVETESLLEAALLESDEIKRVNPPYNVQLRSGDRRAWFATRGFDEAVAAPDAAHPLGPLPSERAVAPLFGSIALARGAPATTRLRAVALAVPSAFSPDEALFNEGWQGFTTECLERLGGGAATERRVLRASRALWLERGHAESEPGPEDAPPDFWDLARVRRRLERSLVQTGLLVRRARFLCLLTDAVIGFQEPNAAGARVLVMAQGLVLERRALADVSGIAAVEAARPPALAVRRASFDAATYDRLRVLSTELRRVQVDGGHVALRIGAHVFGEQRVGSMMQGI